MAFRSTNSSERPLEILTHTISSTRTKFPSQKAPPALTGVTYSFAGAIVDFQLKKEEINLPLDRCLDGQKLYSWAVVLGRTAFSSPKVPPVLSAFVGRAIVDFQLKNEDQFTFGQVFRSTKTLSGRWAVLLGRTAFCRVQKSRRRAPSSTFASWKKLDLLDKKYLWRSASWVLKTLHVSPPWWREERDDGAHDDGGKDRVIGRSQSQNCSA